MNRKETIDELIANYQGKVGRKLPFSAVFARHAARKYYLMGQQEIANQYSAQCIEIFNRHNVPPNEYLVTNYFILGNFSKAKELLLNLSNSSPNNLNYLRLLAICESKIVENNGRTKALAIIQQIKEMTKQDPPRHNGLKKDFVYHYLFIASIYTHLNETELALEYVKKALDADLPARRFQDDITFAPLYENERFRELVKMQN